MAVFFLAEIEVFDPEKYRTYIAKASPVVRRYGGEYVFRSDRIFFLAQEWTPGRMILIRFDTREDMHLCFCSEEYLRIKHLREQSTKSRAVIIEEDMDAGYKTAHPAGQNKQDLATTMGKPKAGN